MFLPRIRAHLTVLKPGAGYAPHTDSYDVAIIVLDGNVDTLGQTVSANGVIYYSAGEPHGMRNSGDEDAVYLVFELYGSAADFPSGKALGRKTSMSKLKRRLKRILRKARWLFAGFHARR